MAQARRSKVAWFAGLLLLAATIGIPAWLLNRGKADTAAVVAKDSLDIVCTGRVDAAAMVIALDPSQPGRVVEVFVQEGAMVKKGDRIVRIDDRMQAMKVQNAEAAVKAATLELAAAKIKFKMQPLQIKVIEKTIDAGEAGIKGLQARVAQLQKQVEANGGGGTIPITKADVDAAQAQVDSGQHKLDAERINLQLAKAVNPKLELDGVQLKLDTAAEALTQAKVYLGDCTVKAPADGEIIRLQTALGATLVPASPLDPAIVFAPAGPKVVRAEVEQADLGRVTIGMTAELKDDTRREAMTLTGKVTGIAKWVAPKKRMLLDPGEFNDVRTTEVIIAIDPTQEKLWIGQRILVRIVDEAKK